MADDERKTTKKRTAKPKAATRRTTTRRAKPKAAAFIDVDKTLIPGSSLFLLARGMYERDFFRVRDIIKFGLGQLRFVLGGKENQQGIDQSRDESLSFVKGRYQDEIKAWGREIVEERILPRVYEDVARVIETHSTAKEETYLVTATPIELAGFMAEALGMTGAIGTEAEIDEEGRYTGKLVGEIVHGPEKAKAIAELAAEKNIDLSISSAYTDSSNDLPMLESVGHPHAVNPDPELRRIARARGWPVHELRTRRRALLIGIPSALTGAGLLGAGMAIGVAIGRRRAEAQRRRLSLRRRR